MSECNKINNSGLQNLIIILVYFFKNNMGLLMQLLCVSFTLGIESTVLDDYLAEPEAVFKWNEVPELSF